MQIAQNTYAARYSDSNIKIICDLKKNDYLKELEENEIEEILYYKRLFEDIYKDFQDLGI